MNSAGMRIRDHISMPPLTPAITMLIVITMKMTCQNEHSAGSVTSCPKTALISSGVLSAKVLVIDSQT